LPEVIILGVIVVAEDIVVLEEVAVSDIRNCEIVVWQ